MFTEYILDVTITEKSDSRAMFIYECKVRINGLCSQFCFSGCGQIFRMRAMELRFDNEKSLEYAHADYNLPEKFVAYKASN